MLVAHGVSPYGCCGWWSLSGRSLRSRFQLISLRMQPEYALPAMTVTPRIHDVAGVHSGVAGGGCSWLSHLFLIAVLLQRTSDRLG